MAKGTPITIAGSAYSRVQKSRKNKRKAAGSGYDKMVTKRPRITGSGDYSYRYKGKTPFADVGRHIGSYFGYSGLGSALGHGIGRILGSGDYETGPMVRSNVLVNSTEVPEFAGAGRGNIVMHREYIADVITSPVVGQFANSSYTVNPGNGSTFPWLSTIAQNYEQYKVHGMVFMFKSTSGESVASTNTALGTVIMATDYNVNAQAYRSKNEMEQSQFAQSFKSSRSAMHGIECAQTEIPLNAFYVRTGDVGATDSIKWYDLANFQIATQGFQAASVNIGELWVTYLIEFLKPQVPYSIGGTVNSERLTRSSTTNAAPLGLIGVTNVGNLNVVASSTTIVVSQVQPQQLYRVEIAWACTASVAWTAPVLTFTNCTALAIAPSDDTTGTPTIQWNAPANGVASADNYQQVNVRVNDAVTSFTVNVPSWVGPVNVANYVTIVVTQLDNAIFA